MGALQNFGRWVYLMQQVHEARYYIKKAEELGHPHLLRSYEAILDFLVYFRGALNSYAKCFVSTGPGKSKFDKSIFGSNAELVAKHEKIMALRHTYVAHSDENECESLAVSENNAGNELVLNLEYNISFPFDRLYELRELIHVVEVVIVDRQQSHIKSIEREVGKPVRVLKGGENA